MAQVIYIIVETLLPETSSTAISIICKVKLLKEKENVIEDIEK